MKLSLSINLALLLVSAAVAAEPDPFQGLPAKLRPTAAETARRNRETILAEIKTLGDHPWAGEYYFGDGLGVNVSLVIAPKSGYVFEWHGCLGLYDRNYGTVAWTNGRVRLSFTFENQSKGFQGIAPELIPVPWGSRHYLVPADEVVEFCNLVNSGQEPRREMHGLVLLRCGDERKRVPRFPKVPEAYREYLLLKPIRAAVIAVGASTARPSVKDWRFTDTLVTLDAGAKQGLRVGMELRVMKPWDVFETVKVIHVGEMRSEAVMAQFKDQDPGPKIGWRVSTQWP